MEVENQQSKKKDFLFSMRIMTQRHLYIRIRKIVLQKDDMYIL